ncbi:GNAT family N-acetyltransferase [Bacillus sp. DNRA2]|nr:GNAT family N-acetyltransferase [Bacillus sp. DNRA2]
MLTIHELNDIKELQEICENAGGFQLKLNFDMLENRVGDRKEDFFHYDLDSGKLVGFLGSYGFGSKIELCGMVHPEYRRQGIFTNLLNSAINEAKKHHVSTILLNAPTDSQTAKAFLQSIPCTFSVAEYQMQWQPTELTPDTTVLIRPSVSQDDWEAEVQLGITAFGESEADARVFQEMISKESSDQRYIIEEDGKIVGKMRVSEMNGETWIFGFAVFPELQGKGIGRKALTNVVITESQKGLPIFLEVEAKNIHALKLYESCGFKSYHSQDYYLYQD